VKRASCIVDLLPMCYRYLTEQETSD